MQKEKEGKKQNAFLFPAQTHLFAATCSITEGIPNKFIRCFAPITITVAHVTRDI